MTYINYYVNLSLSILARDFLLPNTINIFVFSSVDNDCYVEQHGYLSIFKYIKPKNWHNYTNFLTSLLFVKIHKYILINENIGCKFHIIIYTIQYKKRGFTYYVNHSRYPFFPRKPKVKLINYVN